MTECNGTITIKYNGRYGNNLFQYVAARIFAEKHNLNLLSILDDKGIKFKDNKVYGTPPEKMNNFVLKDNSYDLSNNEIKYRGPGKYTLDGFFQNENYMYKNKHLISSFIDFTIEKEHRFVLHVRLDDYYFPNKRHLIISTEYYLDCIKKYSNDYDDIYIICDNTRKEWERKYMDKLTNGIKEMNKNPIYEKRGIKDDLKMIYNSNTIVTSNSTFCFWPVFFSHADKIISFPYLGIDVLPNKTTITWGNNPQIFKYKSDNIYFNYFSKNILDYFENMK